MVRGDIGRYNHASIFSSLFSVSLNRIAVPPLDEQNVAASSSIPLNGAARVAEKEPRVMRAHSARITAPRAGDNMTGVSVWRYAVKRKTKTRSSRRAMKATAGTNGRRLSPSTIHRSVHCRQTVRCCRRVSYRHYRRYITYAMPSLLFYANVGIPWALSLHPFYRRFTLRCLLPSLQTAVRDGWGQQDGCW